MANFLYILLAILVFGVMILIHEAGHFLAARACGVKVYEFSLGMGPTLFGWRGKSDTRYNIRAFPIGGFVSMKGEDEDADGEDSFSNKRAWQRFVIVAAGAFMNILLGIIITFSLVLGSTPGSTVVAEFTDGAISSEWLMTGDEIISVNGSRVHTATELSYEILHDGYKAVDIVVLRGGEKVKLSGVTFPTLLSGGMLYGTTDFRVFAEEKDALTVLKHTAFRSISTVKMIYESLVDLVIGRVGMDAVSGPVGVAGAITEAARTGAAQFLYLVSILTMNLGVFNILPLPALDGGRLLFILFEMIFRKKVPPRFEGTVHFVGIIILLGFVVLITFKDVISLFR